MEIDPQTILIIRHAEKPEPGGHAGVDATGAPDAKSLTPRGWQRAGIWTEIFAPSIGQPPVLPKPTAIFASAPETHGRKAAGEEGGRSRRPLETVTSLAAKLGINVDLRFTKGKEDALATAVSTLQGVALVCWQHEKIIAIARALAPDADTILVRKCTRQLPDHWPGDRFNVIFRFERRNGASSWIFEQVVPIMLLGDTSRPI